MKYEIEVQYKGITSGLIWDNGVLSGVLPNDDFIIGQIIWLARILDGAYVGPYPGPMTKHNHLSQIWSTLDVILRLGGSYEIIDGDVLPEIYHEKR